MTTGPSVENLGFLTKEPIALSSYALTCVALKATLAGLAVPVGPPFRRPLLLHHGLLRGAAAAAPRRGAAAGAARGFRVPVLAPVERFRPLREVGVLERLPKGSALLYGPAPLLARLSQEDTRLVLPANDDPAAALAHLLGARRGRRGGRSLAAGRARSLLSGRCRRLSTPAARLLRLLLASRSTRSLALLSDFGPLTLHVRRRPLPAQTRGTACSQCQCSGDSPMR